MENSAVMLSLGVQLEATDLSATSNFLPLSLPTNISKSNRTSTIKKINCGGTFLVIRLCDDQQSESGEELIYFKYSNPNTKEYFFLEKVSSDFNPYYLLKYKETIDGLESNCYQVENVYCTQVLILLQMKNNLIVAFDVISPEKARLYSKDFMNGIGIKEIVTGPLSYQFMVYGTDNILYYYDTETTGNSGNILRTESLRLDFSKKEKYVTGAVSSNSSFVVYETQDGFHQILSHGNDQFRVQSGQPSTGKFSLMNTPFQGQRISQIKCGYFHTCVLLENGDVYSCGYNAYSQCGVEGPEQYFTKVNFPSFPLQRLNSSVYEGAYPSNHVFQPTSITCSSIATTFINKYGFITVGSINSFEEKYAFAENIQCLYHSFGVDKNIPNLETNTVEWGGWHCIIYKNNEAESKGIIYFYENLSKMTSKSNFSDLHFVTEN